jgi:hypothetical protein
VVESATFCKVGSPAQTNNNDKASANAARCLDNGAQSEASEIVLHRLTTSNPEVRLTRRIRNVSQQNADSLRRGQTFSKVCCAKSSKAITVPDNVLRFYDVPDEHETHPSADH